MRAKCFLGILWVLAHPSLAWTQTNDAPAADPLANTKPVPRVQAIPLPDFQTSFEFEGRELTRFRFDPARKRPFWYPLQTTLAPSLVRMGHPHDPVGHRYHYGVWITHSSVNGVNFWDDELDNGKDKIRGSIQLQRVLGLWDGDDGADMLALIHWVAERDKHVVLIEKRYIQVRPSPGAASWLLIVDSDFTAPKGRTATFDPSGFGLLSVRMAKTIGVHDGGGRILNSEGQVNEEQVFRKPARWCDYSGRLTSQALAGVCLFNHPQNPQHPTAFHVRNDGWMCSCLSLEKPVEVRDETPLHVRNGLWVHEGGADQAHCEAMWKKFVELAPADMNRKP